MLVVKWAFGVRDASLVLTGCKEEEMRAFLGRAVGFVDRTDCLNACLLK